MRVKFADKQDRREWHKWFAWRPVFIERELVWLEKIERMILHSYADSVWYYRFPGE